MKEFITWLLWWCKFIKWNDESDKKQCCLTSFFISPSILTYHSPKCLAPPPSLVPRSMGDPSNAFKRTTRLKTLFYSFKQDNWRKLKYSTLSLIYFHYNIDITLNRKLELMLIQFQSVKLVLHSSSLTLIDFQLYMYTRLV